MKAELFVKQIILGLEVLIPPAISDSEDSSAL